MPVHRGKDSNGSFYQYGNQKKYYYKTRNQKLRNNAYLKAKRQEKAILLSSLYL